METLEILEERGKRYGQYKDNAQVAQCLKKILFASGYHDLPDVHKEALDMICSKIARIINGDCNYEDNWEDIKGYSELVLISIKERKGNE